MDIYISSDLGALTTTWMGDGTMTRELWSGGIRISGLTQLRRNMMKWLGTNCYANSKPVDKR